MEETAKISIGESRIDRLSIENILHDLNYRRIVNHERNRASGQWNSNKKTTFIDSILRGYVVLPITVVQKGTGMNATLEIVDGGQRISMLEDFKNNVFKLGSKIRNKKIPPITIRVPKMVDKLDEKGKVVKELLPGKKRRTPVKVPLLDDNGRPVLEDKEFSIANKHYKDLPPELQQAFLRYDKMLVVNMVNYTETETRELMRRFNMGTAMNPAQIGVILSSDEIFAFVKRICKHDLFKNCSTWTRNEGIKAAVERCITESYVLMYDPDNWVSTYTTNVDKFNMTATEGTLQEMEDIMDSLASVVGEDEYLIDRLNNKNMFLILANFKTFFDEAKYELSDYAKFLHDWFDHIKDASTYNEDDKEGTKSKQAVLKRLQVLNEELSKWLEVNGTIAGDTEDDEEVWDATAEEPDQSDTDNTSEPDDDDLWGDTPENNSNTIDSNTIELSEDADAANEQTQTVAPTTEVESQPDTEPNPTESKLATETLKIYADITELTNHDVVRRLYNQEPGYVKGYMTKAMMVASTMSDYHFEGFDGDKISKFINKINSQPATDIATQVDDCKYYLDCLDEYLISVPSDSDFITDENMLCLLNVIKMAQNDDAYKDVEDNVIRDWIIKFVDEYDEHSRFAEMSSDNHDYVIMGKISYLSSELSKYISDLWVDGM